MMDGWCVDIGMDPKEGTGGNFFSQLIHKKGREQRKSTPEGGKVRCEQKKKLKSVDDPNGRGRRNKQGNVRKRKTSDRG